MATSEGVMDNRVIGEWQQPVNVWAGNAESIHNDSKAASVGLRGGPIPGVIHLGHFGPLMTNLFGERWLRTGSISMFYTYVTTNREDVRAVLISPTKQYKAEEDVQLDALVENMEGKTVCSGTVAVGKPQSQPYIRGLGFEHNKSESGRILAAMKPGTKLATREDFAINASDESLQDPTNMFRALQMNFPRGSVAEPALGMYGATEILLHDGPIKSGVPYRKSGEIVHVGMGGKTEFAWVDSWLHDANGGLIAEMRHMTRWMKASSPLWKPQ